MTVYFGKRKGSASTADLSAAAVRETVEKACAIARYTAEDHMRGSIEPEALARDIPDLDLDHPWELSPEQAVELARDCEAAGLAVDPRLSNSEGASVSSQRGRARVRQLAGLPRRLFATSPLGQLRADRAAGRGHAARLLVHRWRAIRRTRGCGAASAASPASARWRAWARSA